MRKFPTGHRSALTNSTCASDQAPIIILPGYTDVQTCHSGSCAARKGGGLSRIRTVTGAGLWPAFSPAREPPMFQPRALRQCGNGQRIMRAYYGRRRRVSSASWADAIRVGVVSMWPDGLAGSARTACGGLESLRVRPHQPHFRGLRQNGPSRGGKAKEYVDLSRPPDVARGHLGQIPQGRWNGEHIEPKSAGKGNQPSLRVSRPDMFAIPPPRMCG